MLIVASLFSCTWAGAAEVADIPKLLREYYDDPSGLFEHTPDAPWEEAMEELNAAEAATVQRGATFLRALLERSLADELSGEAPWKATPFWGSFRENPARNLRKAVLFELERMQVVPGGRRAISHLPLLKWYLESEKLIALQQQAAEILEECTFEEAGPLAIEIASDPKTNRHLRTVLVKQATKRALSLPRQALEEQLRSSHEPLRQAARAHWQKQLGKDAAAVALAGLGEALVVLHRGHVFERQ